MIKAASIFISILLLCAAGSSLSAQPSTTEIATAEALHRQANMIELRRTLDQAAATQKQGDIKTAAQQYEKALNLVSDIGVGVDRETKEAVAGFLWATAIIERPQLEAARKN